MLRNEELLSSLGCHSSLVVTAVKDSQPGHSQGGFVSPEPPVPWGHSMAVSQQTQSVCATSSGGFVQTG